MSKIKLGLDIGTNSIGWGVLVKEDGYYDFVQKVDAHDKPIPSKGSYTFSKGADASENSKAAERRGFRSARRRTERIRLRKIATLKILAEYGLCPPFEAGELNRWKNKNEYPCNNTLFIEWQRTGKKGGNVESEKLKQPYYLRHLAATQPELMETLLGKHQLGRAFYHMAQRRGYLSNSDEEQTDDKLEQFKDSVLALLEQHAVAYTFLDPFDTIQDQFKSDAKVKTLTRKIKVEIKKTTDFEKVKLFIQTEFDKPENLGTVMRSITELSSFIENANKKGECAPTLGSYFYSIYAKRNRNTQLIEKIRGSHYTHRNEHYLKEFNHICDTQKLQGELKEKLHNAIFYQRPLKSQKGLVGTCVLETKRKRIATSHPLFEEFRIWESINRIKIKREGASQLEFLNKEEKELIKDCFSQKSDFVFKKLAEILSLGQTYRYIKDRNLLSAAIEFNFPMDKSFSACPTSASLKKILGKEQYATMPFLNGSHPNEKGKKQVSIEDVWHCLFSDSWGNKDRNTFRKDFAQKHLNLTDEEITQFQKIKLVQGYGSLSKAALVKILPFLERGELYTHAVFLANITQVLGRKLSSAETQVVLLKIKAALETHKYSKFTAEVVNNYIARLKDIAKDPKRTNEIIANHPSSIACHRASLNDSIVEWVGVKSYACIEEKERCAIEDDCWNLLYEAALDKDAKAIDYLQIPTIPEVIETNLKEAFPNDTIKIEKLYHPSAMESYPKVSKKLGNPEIASIKNPVFDKAMHQVKRLCNELIRNGLVDKNTEVNVEVAGEINSASYRRALSTWQREQETIKTWAREQIISLYQKDCHEPIDPKPNDIVKYILYSEQNKVCLYTGKTIGICDFLGGKTTYDIEHTIPRSKCNDNSLTNKTLANADFNRNHKKDIFPALLNISYDSKHISKETILEQRDKQLKSYSISNKQVVWNVSLETLQADYKKYKNAAKAVADPTAHDALMEKVHLTKLKLDYLRDKYRNFEREEISSAFTNANLVDTRMITKYARAYLNSYFNRVNVVNGKITDTLKKMWGIQGEFDTKDRSNHIHHCIDAIVVACVEKGSANMISEAYHLYEHDFFQGNKNPRFQVKEPMKNMAGRMKELHKEVLIFHKSSDRIKPLLNNVLNGKQNKLNLRGKLNSMNPYAHIKDGEKFFFAQRKSINNITGKDIESIVDEKIKMRLLKLAEMKGWESLLAYTKKEGDIVEEVESNHKKGLAFNIYSILKKAKANSSLMNVSLIKEDMNASFVDKITLKEALIGTALAGLDSVKMGRYEKKIVKAIDDHVGSRGLDILLKETASTSGQPYLMLPAYFDADHKKTIAPMIIKKLRLRVAGDKLRDYKKYRKIDQSKKPFSEHKHDYYFNKEGGSNYEARFYGDLIPDEKGKLRKRSFRLINTHNIVKNIFDKETAPPVLKLHANDMVLVFDKSPDEINWDSVQDLQSRLYRVVKFEEDGEIISERHNYASGDVDHATGLKSESNLLNEKEVVLRRRPSTLKVISVKVKPLGTIEKL